MNIKWSNTKSDIDIGQLMNLYQEEWWCHDREKSSVLTMLDHTDFIVAGLCPENKLCAFARVLTDRTYKALIFDVIVRKDIRGQSVGKQLIEQVLDHKMLKNVKSFELYCPERMTKFYTKLGFKIRDAKLLRLEID